MDDLGSRDHSVFASFARTAVACLRIAALQWKSLERLSEDQRAARG
jgi:hypothetical protein